MPNKWEVGAELEGFMRGPITPEMLRAYAQASKDTNPIHWDREFAKSAGFDKLIAHGMLSMAFMADLLRKNFPSDKFHLELLKSRFRKVVFEGDRLRCSGTVKSVDGDKFSISLAIIRGADEVVTDGSAVMLALPPK